MKKSLNNTKALYTVILATIVGGGLAVFGKIGVMTIPPFTFTFLRFLIGSLFLLPFLPKLKKTTVKNIIELGSVSLLSTTNIILFSVGIRLTSATISQLLYTFVPSLVALLSIFFLKKKTSRRQIFGILVGLAGMFYLILYQTNKISTLFVGSSLGTILIAVGVFLFALYLIYSKKLQNQYSPGVLIGAFIGTTIIASFILALFELKDGVKWVNQVQQVTVISLLYVGILGTGVFYYLNQYVVKHGGPLIASLIQYTQPPATLIWAMLLLQEKITTPFIIGSILAYLGVWLVAT